MGKKKKEKIRVIALAILVNDEHIFVTEYFHSTTGEPYYRPLGGGVDFYETGEQATRRELLEEIEADLVHVKYAGMLENIFQLDGKRAHQICLMYQARFAEVHRNEIDYVVVGKEGKKSFNAMWKPLTLFRENTAPLYPNGLLDLLDKLLVNDN